MIHSAFASTAAPLSRFAHPRCAPRLPRVLTPKCSTEKLATPAPFVRTHIQAPLTGKTREVPFSSASGVGPTDQSEVSQVVLRGYQLVGLLNLARSVAFAIFAPKMLGLLTADTLSQTTEMLTRTMGIMEITPVAFLFCIQAAVADGQVNSNVTKRLAWCLLLSEIALYAIRIAFRGTLGVSQTLMGVTAIFPLSLLALYYAAYSTVPVMSIFDGAVAAVKDTFKKQSWMAAYYSLFVVSAIIGVLVRLLSPGAMFMETFVTGELTEVGAVVIRMWTPFVFLWGVGGYTLREAVEEGNLGTLTSKVLNLSLLILIFSFIGMATLMFRSSFTNIGLAMLGVKALFAVPVMYNLFAETD